MSSVKVEGKEACIHTSISFPNNSLPFVVSLISHTDTSHAPPSLNATLEPNALPRIWWP